jgi:predicted subunit of tRNA(5-methylaminomethyl-2-thiouridylate) methyltransferase
MSIFDNMEERAKYTYLLQLSKEQIRAIEERDNYAFDRLLRAKHAIIKSLVNAQNFVASDPTMPGVIAEIKASEAEAERILTERMTKIKRELTAIHAQKHARNAYRKYKPAPRMLGGMQVDRNTPRYIDRAF